MGYDVRSISMPEWLTKVIDKTLEEENKTREKNGQFKTNFSELITKLLESHFLKFKPADEIKG